MGGWALWMAARGSSMAPASGWQASLTADLNHIGHQLASGLSAIPGWVVALVLVACLALLARQAARELGWLPRPRSLEVIDNDPPPSQSAATVHDREDLVEHTSP
jgi:hypothetical protein